MILVAGIGNIFLGDDGFGVEVVRRLGNGPGLPGVCVSDYGLRGMHLACDLMDSSYDLVVLVDAVSRGDAPGTLTLLEPDPAATAGAGPVDAHGMTPHSVLATLTRMGVKLRRVLVLGCEPLTLEEEMGLSQPVAAAVDDAVAMLRALLQRETAVQTGRK